MASAASGADYRRLRWGVTPRVGFNGKTDEYLMKRAAVDPKSRGELAADVANASIQLHNEARYHPRIIENALGQVRALLFTQEPVGESSEASACIKLSRLVRY